MIKISPSVLSANFSNLKEGIDRMTDAGAEWLHYDVMDGHFVPNISFGYSILNDVSKVTDLYLDVHLMISDPKKYARNFAESGADLITFHYEAVKNDEIIDLIDYIHALGCDAGISIKPDTSVNEIIPYLEYVDLVLVMSVEPGFGGQKFMESAVDKIRTLNSFKYEYQFLIEVDGGINAETSKKCKAAGVDVLVAGSYLFKAEDTKTAMEALR